MKLRDSLLLLPLLTLFPAPAFAFDCAKAGTRVETAICAAPALKSLDEELESAYAGLKPAFAPADQQVLGHSQRRWISRRERCVDAEEGIARCIENLTAERLRLLRGVALSGPGPGGRIVPAFLVQDGTPASYDIDIAVLRFAEPKTAGEQRLNQLADDILRGVRLGPHGQETNGATLAREDRLSVSYASPRLLSVRHDFDVYEGGAHGVSGTANYNIDMASGTLLDVKQVLPAPAAAILTLWCKTQLAAEQKKRVPDMEEYLDGRDETIAAHVRDLKRWSIGESEIVVTFDPYEIGSFAEGSYECRFPTAGVKEMALEGALLP